VALDMRCGVRHMGYGSGRVFVESISYVGMQRSERRRKGSKWVLHPEDTGRVMIVSAFC